MITYSPFNPGTKVQTNDEYFETFGRRVYGEVVDFPYKPPGAVSIVRWDYQEGKTIPEHQGMAVVMMTKDLELYRPQPFNVHITICPDTD